MIRQEFRGARRSSSPSTGHGHRVTYDDPDMQRIFGNLPPYLRLKKVLAYNVLIHLRNVADFRSRSPSPEPSPPSDDGDSGHDGNPDRGYGESRGVGPRLHGFFIQPGVEDGCDGASTQGPSSSARTRCAGGACCARSRSPTARSPRPQPAVLASSPAATTTPEQVVAAGEPGPCSPVGDRSVPQPAEQLREQPAPSSAGQELSSSRTKTEAKGRSAMSPVNALQRTSPAAQRVNFPQWEGVCSAERRGPGAARSAFEDDAALFLRHESNGSCESHARPNAPGIPTDASAGFNFARHNPGADDPGFVRARAPHVRAPFQEGANLFRWRASAGPSGLPRPAGF